MHAGCRVDYHDPAEELSQSAGEGLGPFFDKWFFQAGGAEELLRLVKKQ